MYLQKYRCMDTLVHVCIHVCEAHAYVHVCVGGQVPVFACTDVFSCLSCPQTDLLPIKHADVLAKQQNRRQEFSPPHQS